MKGNLLLLFGTLGCLFLATNAEATENQAVRSEQASQNSTLQRTVAQVLDSPSSRDSSSNSLVLDSPSSRDSSSNSLVLDSPSSRDSSENLENSTTQAYQQIDQNNSRRATALNEARQRNDQRIAQENTHRERVEQSGQASTSPGQVQPTEPVQARVQQTQTTRRQVSTPQTQASSSRREVVSTATTSETSELRVAQNPSESSIDLETIKMLELDNITFQCSDNDGTPATIAKINDQDNFPVILWSSNFFSEVGYDAQVRCEQVSARLEAYRKANSSLYITFGKINQEAVICVTSQETGGCGEGISAHEGLVFTLKPNVDPQETLEELATILQSDNQAEQKPLEE
jgi:Circadian oscillating protein COP23